MTSTRRPGRAWYGAKWAAGAGRPCGVAAEVHGWSAARARPHHVRQVLVDRGPADAELPGDAGNGALLGEQQVPYLTELPGGERGRPPEALALGARGGKPVAGPGGDRRAPGVGQAGEYPEDRVPARRGGIEVLAQRSQAGPAPPHLRDDGDHLALRPAELAKVRHHQDVIGAERREALAQPRQAAVAARPVVGEDRRAPDALEYPAMLPGRRRVVTGGSRVPDEPAAVGPFSAQGAGPRLRIRAAHAPSVQERERPLFTDMPFYYHDPFSDTRLR